MASYRDDTLDFDSLQLSGEESPRTARIPTNRPNQRSHSPVDPEARDAALRAELAGVQQINKVIEGVIGSLEKAKANMEVRLKPPQSPFDDQELTSSMQTVSSTVNSANTLLNLWVRILSQTEHTQRLLLSGHWEGGNKDLNDIEQEALAKAQEAERRKEEERARITARERERERAAAVREAADNRPPSRSGRGTSSIYGRGRGKVGVSAGGSSSTAGSSRVPAPSSIDTSRGRGIPTRGLRRGGGRLGSSAGIGRGTSGRGIR